MTRRQALAITDTDFWRRLDESRRCSGVVVAQLRQAKGWTPEELAQSAGVSTRWLKALEADQLSRNYRNYLLFEVAAALGFGVMEVKDFVGLIEDMVTKNLGPRKTK